MIPSSFGRSSLRTGRSPQTVVTLGESGSMEGEFASAYRVHG